MIGRSVALLSALVVLAGCSGGGSEPDPEATTVAPKTYTAAQLEAAMPEIEDLPEAQKIDHRCPGDDECPELEEPGSQQWSVSFVPKPGSSAAAERAADEASIPDTGQVAVRLSADADAARDSLKEVRDTRSEHVGDFGFDAELEGEGYRPGKKGHGTLDDLSIGDWSGFVAVEKFAYLEPDGDASGPRQEVYARVVHGPVSVIAFASVDAQEREDDVGATMVRQLLTDYLDRLG